MSHERPITWESLFPFDSPDFLGAIKVNSGVSDSSEPKLIQIMNLGWPGPSLLLDLTEDPFGREHNDNRVESRDLGTHAAPSKALVSQASCSPAASPRDGVTQPRYCLPTFFET